MPIRSRCPSGFGPRQTRSAAGHSGCTAVSRRRRCPADECGLDDLRYGRRTAHDRRRRADRRRRRPVASLRDQALLVTPGPGPPAYLLYDGQRAVVDLADTAVVRALRLEGHAPRVVSQSLLNAIPEAPPITAPRIRGAGDKAAGLPGFPVGSVLRITRAEGDEYYACLTAGVQRIGQVAADLLRFSNSQGTADRDRSGARRDPRRSDRRHAAGGRLPRPGADAARERRLARCARRRRPAPSGQSGVTFLAGSGCRCRPVRRR